jgi:hypothetical protein
MHLTIYFAVVCLAILAPAGFASARAIDLKTEPPDLRLTGVNQDDFAGQTVLVGDVNGDARDDMIIGARGVDFDGRSSCGAIYIVLSSDTLTSPIDFSSNRPDLKRIYGPAANAQAGSNIACGDINNDGRWDIICGIPTASPNGKFSAGEVHIIYGSDSPADTLDLAGAASGVTVIQGENVFDKLGESVAVGNVNGDSFGDVLAGAPFATAASRQFAGILYVIHGSASLAPAIDLTGLVAGVTRVFGSGENDTFGTSCFSADATNDGVDDILAGAPQATVLGRTFAGAGYLVPGSETLPDTIDTLDDSALGLVKIFGAEADALAGSGFAVGDLDGDDLNELLVSSPAYPSSGRVGAGVIHVFNGATALPESIDLAAPPVGTARIDGPAAGLKIGFQITTGDLNFDGIDDAVIGVPEASPPDVPNPRTEAGTVYIVFGRGVLPPVVDLAVVQTGITSVYGAAQHNATGVSVAVGRLNGDGFDDLLIGANTTDQGGAFSAGEAIAIMGAPGITPTQVLFFDAWADGGSVWIEWQTRDDIETDRFEVIRTTGGPGGGTRRLPAAENLTRTGYGTFVFEDKTADTAGEHAYTVSTTGSDPQTLFTVTVNVPRPAGAALHANAPNPFRAQTSFLFEIPRAGRVAIRIYDVRGALVATIGDKDFSAGASRAVWNGRTRTGAPAPTGVYFARMEFEGSALERKILLLR